VTGEQSSKIKKFIDDKNINYLIAIGGANEYRTRGIPRGWLISAEGKVVWEGHPGSLTKAMIEEELKHVRFGPTFKLPKALKRAELYLNNYRYADGIKALEKYLKRPKDDDVAAKAKDALEKITKYGKESIEEANKLVDEGQYEKVMQLLSSTEKNFKKHQIGKDATARLKALKKDKEHKVELELASLVMKARLYMDAGGNRQAAAMLKKALKQKKFADTKMLETVQEVFDEAYGKL